MENSAESSGKGKSRGSNGPDNEWGYLRTHLDNRPYLLARKIGSSFAGWLQRRWQAAASQPPSLALLARIPLGARQSVALVDAEGTHVLVAISGDAAPSFFPLPLAADPQPQNSALRVPAGLTRTDGHELTAPREQQRTAVARARAIPGRVSW